MQTILAGPDGKTPAIDAVTGQPLAMEELLRRRGIVAAGNNVSMLGPNVQPTAQPATTDPASAAAATLAARNGGGGGGAMPAVAASTMPNASGTSSLVGAPTDDPTNPAYLEELEKSGITEDGISTLEGLGLVVAGTAAAYAAYRAMKGRGNGFNTSSTGSDPLGAARSAVAPIDAEFYDIPQERLAGPRTQQVLEQRGRKALPAPVEPKQLNAPNKRLSDNSRNTAAQARARQAAQGTSNAAPVAAPGPVRTVNESPDAGIARTLGIDSKVLEQLKRNPGILRTLSRMK